MNTRDFSIGDTVRVISFNRCADMELPIGTVGKVVGLIRDSSTKKVKVVGIQAKLPNRVFEGKSHWLLASEVVLI